jgi:hypothetical protein
MRVSELADTELCNGIEKDTDEVLHLADVGQVQDLVGRGPA